MGTFKIGDGKIHEAKHGDLRKQLGDARVPANVVKAWPSRPLRSVVNDPRVSDDGQEIAAGPPDFAFSPVKSSNAVAVGNLRKKIMQQGRRQTHPVVSVINLGAR
ncbi:MAG: hypothetical protein ABSC55_24790 [Syntrophorhabdales bacterium]